MILVYTLVVILMGFMGHCVGQSNFEKENVTRKKCVSNTWFKREDEGR